MPLPSGLRANCAPPGGVLRLFRCFGVGPMEVGTWEGPRTSDAQQLVQVTQEAIYALLADEPTRGRAGFLISLSDRIGAPPSDRKWRDEWNALKLEAIVLSGQGEFASEEYVNESCTVEKTTKQNHAAIVKLVNRGWYPHEAIAYRLLSSVSPPNVLMTSDCLS